jgi:hypothetical protein
MIAAGVAALPFALRRGRPRADWYWLGVLGAGVLAGLLLWRVLPDPSGDALFHLARVRKLWAFDDLSLNAVDEFVDGGLHPGYAFPLWHAFLALVAKVAGVDPTDVVVHEAAVLTPLAFLVVYEAGAVVFRSRWLGIATLAGTLGLTAFASGSGGALRLLALPATAGGRSLLVPRDDRARLHVPPAPESRAARPRRDVGARARRRAPDVRALHAARAGRVRAWCGCSSRPGSCGRSRSRAVRSRWARSCFLAWLFPTVQDTASFTPSSSTVQSKKHGFDRYPGQFIVRLGESVPPKSPR